MTNVRFTILSCRQCCMFILPTCISPSTCLQVIFISMCSCGCERDKYRQNFYKVMWYIILLWVSILFSRVSKVNGNALVGFAGIRHEIISKARCVCGAKNILADDLLPNRTLRDAISRFLESQASAATSSGNVGSRLMLQGRHPQASLL